MCVIVMEMDVRALYRVCVGVCEFGSMHYRVCVIASMRRWMGVNACTVSALRMCGEYVCMHACIHICMGVWTYGVLCIRVFGLDSVVEWLRLRLNIVRVCGNVYVQQLSSIMLRKKWRTSRRKQKSMVKQKVAQEQAKKCQRVKWKIKERKKKEKEKAY